MDLVRRPRRLRVSKAVRDLVHETDIRADESEFTRFLLWKVSKSKQRLHQCRGFIIILWICLKHI